MNDRLNAPASCYILDEQFRVTLARPVAGADRLAPFYSAHSAIDALPAQFELAVRTLTEDWFSRRSVASESAIIDDLRISVVPLHGPAGLHIGVFVEDAA